MTLPKVSSLECVWSSDSTLLVRGTPAAIGLFRSLQASLLPGVSGLSPARESVMIRFDPLRLRHEDVEAWVTSLDGALTNSTGKLVEIPTLYIGEDLEEVANRAGCSTSGVVEMHAGRVYDAWFLGFVPGFAYLGEVDPQIAMPRRSSPRRSVPSGSVAIAGQQTGIYPRSTPGGWNLIGRTEVELFDSVSGRSRIEPGDQVRFVPL